MRPSRPVSVLVGCGALLMAGIAIATPLIIASLHSRAVTGSERELQNISFVLSREIGHAFRALDSVETSLIERIQALGVASPEDYEQRLSGHDTYLRLRESIGGLPYVDAVTLISAQGKLINFSRYWPIPAVDVSDRDYFNALKSDARLTSFVSEPVTNRGSGTWTIYLARKVQGPQGEFLGLVLGAIQLQYFEDFFGKIALAEESSISLFRRDGVLLVRHPRLGSPGRSYGSGDLFKQVLSNADSGVFRGRSLIDGKQRIIAGRTVAGYPLVVTVATTTAAALADWRRETQYLLAAALLVVLVIGGIVFLSVRQVKSHALVAKAQAEKAEAEHARAVAEAVLQERKQADEELRAQKLQLDTALNNMRQGLLMFDAAGRLTLFNRRFLQIYELAPGAVKLGCTLRDLLQLRKEAGTFKGDPDRYAVKFVDRAGAFIGDPDLGQFTAHGIETKVMELPDGRSVSITNQAMSSGGWISTHDDISDRRQAEKERDRTRTFLNTVIENVPATLVVKDARDHRYVLVNRAGEELFGLSRDDMIGKHAYDIFPKDQAALIVGKDEDVLRSGQPHIIESVPVQFCRKGVRLISTRRIPIHGDDGKPQYLLGVIEDVTERKRAEERIAHLAHHDSLTDLPNRAAFTEQLTASLEMGAKERASFALLCIDLDRFKEVNDVFGHLVGDAVLQEVSRRLRTAADAAFLARVGGDEFILIASSGPQPATAAALAEHLLAIVTDEMELEGHRLRIGLSIGVAIYPTDGTEATTLLGNADAALYRAKLDGRDTVRFFAPDMDQRLRERRALQQELRSAVEHGELHPHYQPQARLDGEIVGFEALVRWNHPTRGLVPPSTFIPIAEESGLIIPIGEWILREVCREAASWPQPLQVAVNLSPVQFRHGDLPALVHSVLLETGLPPGRLELEITEGVLIDDYARGVSVLRRLKAFGVRIALDDFGTGYSSLSYLQAFPFDKIKIDRSFVANLDRQPQSAAIIRAVIGLGRALELPVVAEGVETNSQLAFLSREGCQEVQGYLVGRPAPIEEYADVIGSSRMRRHAGRTNT